MNEVTLTWEDYLLSSSMDDLKGIAIRFQVLNNRGVNLLDNDLTIDIDPENQTVTIRQPMKEPAPVYPQTPRKEDYIDFGDAIRALKAGKKVKRKDWGGYWKLYDTPLCSQEDGNGWVSSFQFNNGLIVAVLKDMGGCAPAQAYQADILAEDWEVIK